MTIIRPSRSIAGGDDSALPTLELVLERLATIAGVSARTRADCRSALRSFGRIMGRPLNEIPASPRYLRSRMDGLSPARIGLTRGRWANIRSLVLKSLKLVGVTALPSRHLNPLSPEWRHLYDLMPKRPQRVNLSRFMHRCSELGVGPQDVDQETFQRFADEIEEYGLRSRPHEAYRESCRAWNWALENISDRAADALTDLAGLDLHRHAHFDLRSKWEACYLRVSLVGKHAPLSLSSFKTILINLLLLLRKDGKV